MLAAFKMSDRQLRFYGRRTGRRLRPSRVALLEEVLPQIEIRHEAGRPLKPGILFDPKIRDVWLEIGFGGGEHLAWQARHNPDIGFIGAEPYVNGVASLLVAIKRWDLTNIRILPEDIRLLLPDLGARSIGRAFILFPDPWPKVRHHRRRIINRLCLDHLARLLPSDAELRVATDDPGYLGWILRHTLDHPSFAWNAQGRGDWETRPPDWPETRYESKTIAAGRRPAFLRFVRV